MAFDDPGSDFVRRLRMNNIFPTGGFNPLQPPQRPGGYGGGYGGGGGIDVGGMLNQIQSQRDTDRLHDEQRQDSLYYRQKGDRLAELGRLAAIKKEGMPRITNEWTGTDGMPMGTVLGDQGGKSIAARLGSTLDQERASIDKGQEVKPNYIPEQTPQEQLADKLKAGEQVIEGNKQVAKATATAAALTQQQKDAASKERADAKAKSDRETKMAGAGTFGTVKDPKTGEDISVIMKPDGTVVRAKLDEGDVGDLTKFGTKRQPTAAEIAAKEKNKKYRDVQKSMGQSTLDAINQVLDDKGELTGDAKWATGVTGLAAPFAFGTKAKSAVAKLKNIQSKQVLQLIGELKSQSATGATGMGNLNMKEFGALQDAASLLDRTGSQDEYQKQLGIVRDKLKLLLEDSDDEKAEAASATTQEDSGPKDRKTNRTPSDLYNQYSKPQGGV